MKEAASLPRGPRPLAAFLISFAGSAALLTLMLLSDRRVLELKKARAEIRQLDQQIGERRSENERLRAEVEAANRHEFPAEEAAREELHLVHPEDVVLSFPPGSLSGEKPTPIPAAGTAAPSKAPAPR